MIAFVISTCDVWKSSSSMRPVGVYTNKKKLFQTLRSMLRNKTIELPEGSPIEGSFSLYSTGELNSGIDYLYLEEICLNKPF